MRAASYTESTFLRAMFKGEVSFLRNCMIRAVLCSWAFTSSTERGCGSWGARSLRLITGLRIYEPINTDANANNLTSYILKKSSPSCKEPQVLTPNLRTDWVTWANHSLALSGPCLPRWWDDGGQLDGSPHHLSLKPKASSEAQFPSRV